MKRFMNLGKRFLAIALIAMSLLGLMSGAALAVAGTIDMGGTSGAANVRSTGSSSGNLLGTIGTGSTVDVTGSANASGYIQITTITPKNGTITKSGVIGYVLAQYVKTSGGGGGTGGDYNLKNGDKGIVETSSGGLNVRNAGNSSATVLGTISSGSKVDILASMNSNGFYYVYVTSKTSGTLDLTKNRYGYVSADFIKRDGNGNGDGTAPKPVSITRLNQGSNYFDTYHASRSGSYFELANRYFISRGYDIYNEKCGEFNEDTYFQCNTDNKEFYVKLQFAQVGTKPCTKAGCTITTDKIDFTRNCTICRINMMYYDYTMYHEIHSNSSCPNQKEPGV